MEIMSISWELLTSKQKLLLLPLMRYAVSDAGEVEGDVTNPLPDTTFSDMQEAWGSMDRLSLSEWVTEESIADITTSLDFLAKEAPNGKVKEIVDYYN